MKPDVKKLVILNLPYLIFVYLFGKCGQAYRLAAGADLSGKLLHLADGFTAAFANPLPSLHLFDFCVGIAGALIVRLVVYCKGKNAKKYRKGVEYGSARWGTAKDMYHNADRRRTMGKITAALPDMDGDMRALAQQTLSKLERMTDADYDNQKFNFTYENE